MKATKIIIILIYSVVFTATVSAYSIDGEIYENNTFIDLGNVSVNIQNFTVSTNATGEFVFNNSFAAGNYTVNITFPDTPKYYNMAIPINLTSDLFMSIAVDLKPTGTITGCVSKAGGSCLLGQAVSIISSNRIRWFF